MKNILKKFILRILPNSYALHIKKIYIRIFQKYKSNHNSVFTDIYFENKWASKESFSGKGSNVLQTKMVVKGLNEILTWNDINLMVDLPCGDFNWMKYVQLGDVKYVGGDLVEQLIIRNNEKYSIEGKINFEVIDLIEGFIPKCDLLFVRDCLVHLPYSQIKKVVMNIINSHSKYLLTTTFVERSKNNDIIMGDWRPLNLELAPFRFPKPLLIINEACTEGDGIFSDKSLGLWKIKDLAKEIS